MNSIGLLLLLFLAVHFYLCVGLQSENAGIEVPWVSPIFTSDVLTKDLEPTGLLKGAKTFLCRAYNNFTMKPGALVVSDGSIYCQINNFGAHKLTMFQTLEAPYGSTSWISVNISIPRNAVIGGNHYNGKLAYPCRGWYEGNLYIGNYAEGGYCHTVIGERPQHLTENLELLVVNHYGKSVFV